VRIYKEQIVEHEELLAAGWTFCIYERPPESEKCVWYDVIYSEQLTFNVANFYYATACWWLDNWYCFIGTVQYWKPKDE
jgi:hypothetical protein